VKPAAFEYLAPATMLEALEARAAHSFDSAILAGGQSLVPLLNLRMAQPGVVIDLNGLPELAGIHEDGNGIEVGAMVRQRDLERSALVAQRAPLLARALPLIAHPPIRARGTIGGSLAHADPAAELPAVAVALDATLLVQSAERGTRTIEAAAFFQGALMTALEPDELLVGIRFPAMPGARAAFHEVTRRHGDFALAGAAATVVVEDGVVRDARIVLIGLGDAPVRDGEVEARLVGRRSDPTHADEAARVAGAGLDAREDIHATAAYRRHCARVVTARAVREVLGVAA
jgi:carbon-monoxide dehydrogenase medium subunit